MEPRPLIVPAPSSLEAAAIVAALDCFIRDTAAPRRERPATVGGWLRVARLEAVGGEPQTSGPWDESTPWPAAGGAPSQNP
jgi:hypothetical protein